MTDSPWTRCPACQTRLMNAKADIDGHKLNCPYDIKIALQKALKRIDVLERAVTELDAEPAAAPSLDLENVAPWPDDEPDVPEAGIFAEVVASYPEPVAPAIDDYDDDEDEEPLRITSPVMR